MCPYRFPSIASPRHSQNRCPVHSLTIYASSPMSILIFYRLRSAHETSIIVQASLPTCPEIWEGGCTMIEVQNGQRAVSLTCMESREKFPMIEILVSPPLLNCILPPLNSRLDSSLDHLRNTPSSWFQSKHFGGPLRRSPPGALNMASI